MLLTRHFLSFSPFSVNLTDGYVGKFPAEQQFLKYSDVWHQQPRHVHNPLFPRSDTRFKLQQVVVTMSTCLNTQSCCHVFGYLDICHLKVNFRDVLNSFLIAHLKAIFLNLVYLDYFAGILFTNSLKHNDYCLLNCMGTKNNICICFIVHFMFYNQWCRSLLPSHHSAFPIDSWTRARPRIR